MSWRKLYKEKLTTAEEAVKHIRSGDRVVFGHAAGEPKPLIEAMVANYKQYRDVEIVHLVALGEGGYCKPEMAGHFRHNAAFAGGVTRGAINEGRADFTPVFFHEMPKLIKKEILKTDVGLVQVSPPDKHGFCSLGVAVDYTKAVVENARTVIAEVNQQMPRVYGDCFVHISQLTHIVETDRPLYEINPPKIGPVERGIGENCASLIEDGATLQLGIGAIPDAVLLFLKDKKDLGIHSEMVSDGLIELYEAGVVNNSKKSMHKGKMVITFIMGTKKLYDFIDNNPVIEMHPVDYVNDPVVISKNSKMTTINSCIQVDFLGQVVSDTMGTKQFSGVGGQVDFVRGSSMADDGVSIIAMPSTAKGGTVSRVVPFIDHGAAVTTSRNDVHYVVTEYGVADLYGKTSIQRAKNLINIAHPDFKDELIVEFEKRFNVKFD